MQDHSAAHEVDGRPSRDPYTVVLAGEVDMAREAELHHLARTFVQSGAGDVVVDLSGVTFVDSTGLAFLVTLRCESTTQGGHVVLHAPTERVMDLLTIFGFDRIFEFSK